MKQHLASCKACGVVVRAITVVPPGDEPLLRRLLDTVDSSMIEFTGLPCPVCPHPVGGQVPKGDYNWQMVT